MTLLARLNPFAAVSRFFKAHSLTLIIYSLVGNTALAQLFYNSAGVILPNSDVRTKYLIFSAFLSMVAFSLFELHVVRQLKELLGKEKEIRQKLPKWEIPAHIVTLAVISAYNIYSLFLLNAAIWPSLEATVTGHPSHTAIVLPELPGLWKYLSHAIFYSIILFLAAVVVERKKSAAEQAAEEDEALHREMIDGSNDYYRQLIKKGGRTVVVARGVLSTTEAAKRQAQLLAALEGRLTIDQAVAVAVPAAEADTLVAAASLPAGEMPVASTPPHPSPFGRWSRRKAQDIEEGILNGSAPEQAEEPA